MRDTSSRLTVFLVPFLVGLLPNPRQLHHVSTQRFFVPSAPPRPPLPVSSSRLR